MQIKTTLRAHLGLCWALKNLTRNPSKYCFTLFIHIMYFPRDADLERLLEQWDEDEEPLPVDELPEWDPRKPQPEIRMEDMQNKDPEDLLRSAGLTY